MNISSITSCSGCGACAYICPTNAISIDLNEDGFYFHSLNSNKCINCERCVQVCSHSNENISIQRVADIKASSIYKARAKNEDISSSSSGGIAYLLMKLGIKKGAFIAGVRYNTSTHVAEFSIGKDLKSIEKFRGSKYIQANPNKLLTYLHSKLGKYVFIGSPCQVYGYLQAMQIEKRIDDFLFVDFFCHGVPSSLLWEKTVKEMVGCKVVRYATFRDKTHGYHEYHICFTLDDGSIITSSERRKNAFYQLYDSGYILSPGCYNCKFRYSRSVADLRIGDYWNKHNQQYFSRIAVCTEKGAKALDDIRSFLEIEPITKTHISNDVIKKRDFNRIRSLLIESLQSDEPLKDIVRKYRKNIPFRNKCKKMIKSIIARL